MKRPLVYAAGGFVLGEVWLLLPRWTQAAIPALIPAGVFVLWMFAGYGVLDWMFFRKGRDMSGRSLIVWALPLLCFCVLGAGRLAADRRIVHACDETASQMEHVVSVIEGTLKDISTGNGSSYEAVLEISKVRLHVLDSEEDSSGMRDVSYPGAVLVYLDQMPDMDVLRIGMRISVQGKLERMGKATNPGQFDYETYYHALGVEGRVFGENLRLVNRMYSPYLNGIFRLKHHAMTMLERICQETDRGIFQAVVLGDKTALPNNVRDLYQKNGIAHLLAVSGLHISLIGLGCYHSLRKLGLGFEISGAMAAILTISYGILTGGSASVIRAVIMVCFQLLADKLGRTYDLLSAMAVAAILLLIQSPTLLFLAGFQLSFGAVIAIGAVFPILREWMGITNHFGETVLVGIVIQAVTFPVLVYHYFEYPVYGTILNLIVIPLIGYVLMSGLAAIVLGSVWLTAGHFAVGTGHYILVLYEKLCERFEQMPEAIQIVGRPAFWQIGIYAGLWMVILSAAFQKNQRGKRENGAGGYDGVTREQMSFGMRYVPRIMVFLTGIIAGFLVLQAPPVSGLRVTFLDVGQGDGICLESGEMVILVDGGSSDKRQLGEQILEPFLKSRGIGTIDYAIVSHGDEDHISGLRYLMESDGRIQIRCLVLPGLGQGDERYDELVRLAENKGAKIVWMDAGDSIADVDYGSGIFDVGQGSRKSDAGLGSRKLQIRCLYSGDTNHIRDTNDHSLLLEITYGDAGILLTGDMSADGEKRWLKSVDESTGLSSAIQVLKVAHHGSNYSTSQAFLAYVHPSWGVISCGADNRYGHPGEETVERLSESGTNTFLTMEKGALILHTDGKLMTIRPWKPTVKTSHEQ